MKMLITDLDNTLYDWVTFFAESFYAMVDKLIEITNIEREQVLEEFRNLHQFYGNTERPFTILELPSVVKHFGDLSREELSIILDEPLHAFNSKRKQFLCLYDSVRETLDILVEHGFKIVAYTEAIDINAYFRLNKLNIIDCFTRLYALENNCLDYPLFSGQATFDVKENFIRTLPISERKPNPKLLVDICNKEGVSTKDIWYIGDSITKDIAMANDAGVKSVWAKYGTTYDKSLWDSIVKVTHWTQDDIIKESEIINKCKNIVPDYTINSFKEILHIVGIG